MQSPERIAVILNPAAGRGRARRHWQRLSGEVEAQVGRCSVFETSAPRDGVRLCRQALEQGFTRIISAGGDGTHFEVTNGYFDGDAPRNPDASIAYLPLGSGADFTRTLRVPTDDAGMVALLTRWPTRQVDVVRVDLQDFQGQPVSWVFQNIARAGAGAEVVARAERSNKRFGGFVTFLIATLQTVLTYRSKPVQLTIDSEDIQQQFLELVVANGMYDGGGMRTAPHAHLDDGLLDVYVYGKIALGDALVNLHKIYTGNMMDRPDVVRYAQPRKVRLQSAHEIMIEADGELLGVAPAEFTIRPAALQVVLP